MTIDSEPTHLALASRIRSARDLRGYTQSEVVELMTEPLSVGGLSQIESGKVTPTDGTLRGLASALEVPVGFFSAHWSSDAEAEEATEIYFRDLRSTPARERRKAHALATLLHDLVRAIEQHARLPQASIPRLDVAGGADLEIVDAAARRVRADWSLGLAPIEHVVREVERHGVPVARLSFGHERIDAFALAIGRRPVMFLTNDKENHYVRSRLDASHELGHLVMHTGRGEQDRTVEVQAHRFAASFLYPAEIALTELPTRIDGAGWRQLAALKRKWGMSLAALVRRAKDLDVIGENEYRNAMKFMSVRGWRKDEPGDRELGAPESPLLLERALRTIEVEHDLTLEEITASADLPLADVSELLAASFDTRPVVEF